jgi:hypothetical protein
LPCHHFPTRKSHHLSSIRDQHEFDQMASSL